MWYADGMATLLVKWLVSALAIFLVSYFLPGIHVPDITVALLAALVLGVLNVTVRPILKLLTLPITLLTLGFFSLVVNGFTLWLVPKVVPGFTIDTFWWAVLGALIISLVTLILNRVFLGPDGKVGGK